MGADGLLVGLNSGIESGIRGYYDAEDRKYRRMETEAKLKAQDDNQRRQALLDQYEMEKNSPDRRREMMAFELAKSGQQGQWDENGTFMGSRYRDDSLRKSHSGGGGLGNPSYRDQKAAFELSQLQKGRMLPPDKVLSVQQGAQIPNQLDDVSKTLESNKDAFGPMMGRLGALNPYDEKTQTIDAQVRASAQAFGRYMEGGVLRKEDEEKYRKMFPNLTDTPKVAANKLSIVRKILIDKQNQDVRALRDQGYDISGFHELQSTQLPEVLNGNKGLMNSGLLNKSEGLIQPKANANQASKEDQEAIEWAKKNPNDPRAKQILQMHGM